MGASVVPLSEDDFYYFLCYWSGTLEYCGSGGVQPLSSQ